MATLPLGRRQVAVLAALCDHGGTYPGWTHPDYAPGVIWSVLWSVERKGMVRFLDDPQATPRFRFDVTARGALHAGRPDPFAITR